MHIGEVAMMDDVAAGAVRLLIAAKEHAMRTRLSILCLVLGLALVPAWAAAAAPPQPGEAAIQSLFTGGGNSRSRFHLIPPWPGRRFLDPRPEPSTFPRLSFLIIWHRTDW